MPEFTPFLFRAFGLGFWVVCDFGFWVCYLFCGLIVFSLSVQLRWFVVSGFVLLGLFTGLRNLVWVDDSFVALLCIWSFGFWSCLWVLLCLLILGLVVS